jgi:hypothetical protein
MRPMRRVVLLGAVLVLAAVGVTVMRLQSNGFDSKTWQAQRGVEKNNTRGRMLGALDKYLRVGMPRAEVQLLLGPPDHSEADRDVYELGRSPVGVDFESYVIQYDSAGKVTQFRISRS